MKLYLYYLIIGAPGEEWVVSEFSKIGFKCIEMYSNDIVFMLFAHRSPRGRVGSARIFTNWLLKAWKCTQMTLYLYYLIIGAPMEFW